MFNVLILVTMITSVVFIYFSLIVIIHFANSANILAVFPTPSISHQIVFRPLVLELVKRGHQVTVITTDPAFPEQKISNLTEINIHDVSYEDRVKFIEKIDGNYETLNIEVKKMYSDLLKLFEKQLQSAGVQKMLNDKNNKFDLLLLEHFVRPTLSFSYLYNVPVISINAFGPMFGTFDSVDVANHPFNFPIAPLQSFYKNSIMEKIYKFYFLYLLKNICQTHEKEANKLLKKIFGSEIPNLRELNNNIHMTFLNTHKIWDNNRPVPPNVIYIGGIHQKSVIELPQDLQRYLDDSTNGVIYMSFGSVVMPSILPMEKVKIFVDTFSDLPYNVVLKWDTQLPESSSNVKIAKWFPQSDLLRHKNVKAFITHGGLLSISESIDAGVPVIGIPMFGDHWYNLELCLKHKIGVTLDFNTLSKEKIISAIETVQNESFRKNIVKLRKVLHDQPESPLERAVWWTEYVLRHGGAKHLRSAAAHMHWTEYYELDIILMMLFIISILFSSILYFMKFIVQKLKNIKLKVE